MQSLSRAFASDKVPNSQTRSVPHDEMPDANFLANLLRPRTQFGRLILKRVTAVPEDALAPPQGCLIMCERSRETRERVRRMRRRSGGEGFLEEGVGEGVEC